MGNHIKTTMISPGAVETELYRTISDETVREQTKKQEQENGLKPIDIAHAVAYAIDQPDDVAINEILLRPRSQKV